jgi:Tol biopolymer transport system component
MTMRGVLCVSVVVFCIHVQSFAQVTDWLSPGHAGDAGNGDSGLEVTSRPISADGRYVVFDSHADNLVAGDFNGECDVFRVDRVLGTTVRVSVATDGGDALGSSENPSLSADGRFVAFASNAGDLVPGDGNGDWDVFVRDMEAGTTTRVSIGHDGSETDGPSNRPSIDAAGKLVAFSSEASNLVAGIDPAAVEIYVRNLMLGTTELVSVAPNGSPGDLNSWRPEISSDGGWVVFVTAATNILPGDGSAVDVALRDLELGVTTRVSFDQWGGDPDNRSGGASVSRDGEVVAFWSRASDLVPGDSNGQDDIFVFDAGLGTIARVNVADDGSQALGGGSWHAAVSDDGRYVVFLSDAENLVPGDANGAGDIFAYDRVSHTIELLSFSSSHEPANGFSRFPSVTPEGNTVVFESTASNFVDGDDNGIMDVYAAHGPAALLVDGFSSGDLVAWSTFLP